MNEINRQNSSFNDVQGNFATNTEHFSLNFVNDLKSKMIKPNNLKLDTESNLPLPWPELLKKV